jgi:hypothetical protein
MSVRDFYISRIGLPILLQGNMWTDPGIKKIAHRQMVVNVKIETEDAQFPEKEYINGIYFSCSAHTKKTFQYPSVQRITNISSHNSTIVHYMGQITVVYFFLLSNLDLQDKSFD